MKNLKIISEVLETTKVKLKYNSKLEDFVWDSMSQIKLLTIINKKFKKNVDLKKLKKIKMVNDLDKLINDTIAKKRKIFLLEDRVKLQLSYLKY